MAKIKCTLSIGLVGKQEDIIEVDDEEVDGLTEDELSDYLDDFWNYWSSNYIDGSARILDD
jgi:hypothetical protein